MPNRMKSRGGGAGSTGNGRTEGVRGGAGSVNYCLVFVLLSLIGFAIFFVDVKHGDTSAVASSTDSSLDAIIAGSASGSRSTSGTGFRTARAQGDTKIAVPQAPHTFPNPTQQSKNAYVTLISGIDSSFKYRGFLYNAMIMRKSLRESGSTADFIALIGYREKDTSPFQSDMQLLAKQGIIVYELPRWLDNDERPLSFAEMALLKITPWSFTQYDRVQFFDGDIMPTKNMDCFFALNRNTFTVGAVSPLNSGWYLAIPNLGAYEYMKAKAVWRLNCDWDKEMGWGEQMPTGEHGLMYRGARKPCVEWLFNGADMDQGLLTHYFIINTGNSMLIDAETRRVRVFDHGLLHDVSSSSTTMLRSSVVSLSEDARKSAVFGEVPQQEALQCCEGRIPTTFFTHFTGRSKPWMLDLTHLDPKRPNTDIKKWIGLLDSLQLDVNSSNIAAHQLGSPLGFWNADFPKLGHMCVPTPFSAQHAGSWST